MARPSSYNFHMLPMENGATNGAITTPVEDRYSPDKVNEAVMSFADFLHFLEENHQEHPLMPMIIKRFSDLGTVIEAQKRHIDRWKQQELDLAISEYQQSLDLIKELGTSMQNTEVELASCRVEKQQWEEKYHQLAFQTQDLSARAKARHEESQQQLKELQRNQKDMETVLEQRNALIESMENDHNNIQETLEKVDEERIRLAKTNRELTEQIAQQSHRINAMEVELQQLQQTNAQSGQKAVQFAEDIQRWQQRYHEIVQEKSGVERDLYDARHQLEETERKYRDLMQEGGALHEQVEQTCAKFEFDINTLQSKLIAAEAQVKETADALAVAEGQQAQAEKELEDTRSQLARVNSAHGSAKKHYESLDNEHLKLLETLEDERYKHQRIVAEMEMKLKNLKLISDNKSNEVARLMTQMHESSSHMEEDNDRLNTAVRELGGYQARCEQLERELSSRERRHADELESQSQAFRHEIEKQQAVMTSQKTKIEELDTRLRQAAASEQQLVSQTDEEITRLREVANTAQQHLQSLQQQQEILQQKLVEKSRECESLFAEIENIVSSNDEGNRQIELLSKERKRLEDEKSAMQTRITELDHQLGQLREAYSKHESEKEGQHRMTIRQMSADIDQMRRELEQAETDKRAIEEQFESVLNERDQFYDAANSARTEKATAESNMRSAMDELERVKAELQIKSEELSRCQGNLQAQREEVMKLRRDASSTVEKEQQKHLKSIQDANNEIRTLREQHASALLQKANELSETTQKLSVCGARMSALEDEVMQMRSAGEALHRTCESQRLELERLRREKILMEEMQEREKQSWSDAQQRAHDAHKQFESMKFEYTRRLQEEEQKNKMLQDMLHSRHSSDFDRSSQLIATEAMALKQEIVRLEQVLQTSREDLLKRTNDLESSQADFARLHREMEQLEAEYEDLLKQRDALAKQLETSKTKHEKFKIQYEKFKEDVQTRWDEREQQMKRLQQENTKLQDQVDQTKQRASLLLSQTQQDSMERAQEVLSNEALLKDRNAQVEALQSEIHRLEVELDGLRKKLLEHDTNTNSETKQLTSQVKKLESIVSSLKLENANLRGESEAQSHELSAWKTRAMTYESTVEKHRLEAAQDRQKLMTQLETSQTELVELRKDLELEREAVAELNETIRKNAVELEEKSDEIRTLTTRSVEQARELDRTERRAAIQNQSKAHRERVLEDRIKELESELDELERREKTLSERINDLIEMEEFGKQFIKQITQTGVIEDAPEDVRELLADVCAHLSALHHRELESKVVDKGASISDLELADLTTKLAQCEHQLAETLKYKAGLKQRVEKLLQKVAHLSAENSRLVQANREAAAHEGDATHEWELKLNALQTKVNELQLRERSYQSESKELHAKIEELTTTLKKSDSEAAFARMSISSHPQTRTVRQLEEMLEDRQDKILEMNEHLTALSNQSIRLRLSNEQYQLRLAALTGENPTASTAAILEGHTNPPTSAHRQGLFTQEAT
ncbi:TPA: hypothetical protein N0F65_010323 [Lagenidium giganteum]|uniref:Uncharacterized protein n=1 Tax=Lagenidium giganteum TaxID=4803 RepID=A0AAV2Z4R5_9STRA|nr:TPA: hypothetical protein N0F65_010323 [Lagenidium giganteum]